MVHMSAAVSPALAQTGALGAALSAAPSSDGAQMQDFSAVLADAAHATPAGSTPESTGAAPVASGNFTRNGKETGKILPDGKVPAARKLAASKATSDDARGDADLEEDSGTIAMMLQEPARTVLAPQANGTVERLATSNMPASDASLPGRSPANAARAAFARPVQKAAGEPQLTATPSVIAPSSLGDNPTVGADGVAAAQLARRMIANAAIALPVPPGAEAPAAAPAAASDRNAVAPNLPQGDAALLPHTAMAGDAEPAGHKATHAPHVTAMDTPVALSGADTPTSGAPAAPVMAEPRSAPAPATQATAAATTPTQDISALVDRIAEARAAAAPQTVRAALMHEDFGAVSLNFRTEASHIQVTLGSADPGFAPAVHAAAAASLASNGAGDDGETRRNAPSPQAAAEAQDTVPRNDTSSQQHTARDRAPAAERHAGREASNRARRNTANEIATASTPRRRGGIYA